MSVARISQTSRLSTGKVALAVLLLAATSACSQKGSSQAKSPAETSAKSQSVPELEGSTGPLLARESPRRIGDVWVHRFSGTYRNSALTLREEVVGQKDGQLLVDFILDEEGKETHLRVTMALPSEHIVTVAKVVGGAVIPVAMTEFDAMMEKTTFAPDQNAGRLAASSETCLVGKEELDCDISEYKVLLGEQEGTLRVLRNEELKRDISGEIAAVDGTILYKAELLEMERGTEVPTLPNEGVALKSVDFDQLD
jgi:hypothetical protein